jgi:Tol biopolymer transport system component
LLIVVFLVAVAAPATAHAAYPGANGKIAFSSNEGAGIDDYRIWVMDPDGTDRVALTSGPGFDRAPHWSPDGTKIAFTRGFPFGQSQVYVVNADGDGLTALTNAPNHNTMPHWSPDGTRIVFATSRFGSDRWQLWTMAADGSDERLLIDTFGTDEFPAWSPDGERIVFTGQSSGPWNLWTVRPDGSGLANLTNTTSRSYFAADWSPDGSRIAFDSGHIGVVNSDGTGEHAITAGGNRYAAWAPDGSQIAFTHSFPGDQDIWVMNPDGSGQRAIAELPQEQDQPDWQPVPDRPPDCTGVRATPSSLGAPNHRLITVTISGATDPDGDPVDLTITGVSQDERVTGAPDAVSTTIPYRVRLRAERDPEGDGRVYRIAFEASDGRGGTCTGVATASVRKGSQAFDSAPPSYDSFGS